MKLPLANATLTAVRAGETVQDDTPAGAGGAAKWAGAEGVYLTERSELVTANGSADVVVVRSVVASTDELPVAFEEGDMLTLQRGTETVIEQVRAVQRTEYPGVPGLVELHLRAG